MNKYFSDLLIKKVRLRISSIKQKLEIMKKSIIILLAAMLITPIATFAQLKIKPSFGINFANIKDSEGNFAIDGQTGFSVGGTVQIGRKFVVEPGVFWQKDKYEIKDIAGTAGEVIKGDYSSIKIPLYLGFYIIGDSKSTLGIKVFGGPSAKFNLGAGSDELGGIGEIGTDDIQNAIWGVKAGAGVDFLFLFADLGYNWGLNDVFKGDMLGDLNSQTNHFEITIGLKF